MNKKNKNVLKKAGAVALGLGIVGASVFAGASLFPKTEIETLTVVEYKDKIVTQNVTEIVEVEVPVEVVKEVEVLVDNENLALVLDYIYDNEGDLEFLTTDLFDDEVETIVDRILLVEDVKAQAKSYVESNLARELERQLDYDRRDVSRIKIEDVVFDKALADFKYEEFVLEVEVEYRYNNVEETKVVIVEYYNGRVRSLNI